MPGLIFSQIWQPPPLQFSLAGFHGVVIKALVWRRRVRLGVKRRVPHNVTPHPEQQLREAREAPSRFQRWSETQGLNFLGGQASHCGLAGRTLVGRWQVVVTRLGRSCRATTPAGASSPAASGPNYPPPSRDSPIGP